MNCEIRHSIVIAAAPEVVCAALSEPRQLARWWTREVSLADDLVRLDWSRQGWRVELSIDEGADHQLVLALPRLQHARHRRLERHGDAL